MPCTRWSAPAGRDEGIDILPLEEPVDRHYGQIRAALARSGQPIGQNGQNDLFIAYTNCY